MFFTTVPTAIDSPNVSPAEKDIEVFSLTGVSLGKFDSVQAAKAQLEDGIYVVKSGSEIRKMLKK